MLKIRRNKGFGLKLTFTSILIGLMIMGSIVVANAKETTLNIVVSEYQKKCIDAALEGFYKLYPEIKIEYGELLGGADAFQNMVLALSAGEGIPEVAGPENSRLAQYVALGGLYDITEKALPYYDKMESTKWIDAMDEEERIYAMPWDSGPVAIYYRRDVFEQAGLASDPESVAKLLDTWDDFYEVAKLIKERTGKYMFAQAKANNDFRNYETLLRQQEAGYVDREGKLVIDSSKAVRTLEYLGKFWKEDLIQDTPAWTAGWYAGMAEGEVATVINAVWLGGFLWSWIAPDTAGKWGVVPMPIWEEGGVRSSNDGGSVLLITEACKDKEAGWKFIEYITTNRKAQLIAWEVMDSFPSLLECYTDPFVEEGVPFFGGQAYRKVFAEAARHIPWWRYTKDYSEMNSILQTYVTAYALGEIKSAKEALVKTAAAIRTRTGRK